MGVSLPLPPFDRFGNLDVGPVIGTTGRDPIALTTLADIKQRLVTDIGSPRRQQVWDGWMNHRREIETFGVQYACLVDGSFASTKHDPKDVDLCYLFDAAELNALSAAEQARLGPLFDVPACKSQFFCDPYPIRCYPLGHMRFQSMMRDMAYWSRVYGTDRLGHLKCILLVGERGII